MKEKKADDTSCSCHEKVEKAIGNVFYKFGSFISNHPIKVIIIMLVINGGLGVGMLRLKTDIDVSRVYTPQGSQAAQDEEKILKIFPDTSASEFISYQLVIQGEDLVVLVKPNAGNILDVSFLDELDTITAVVNNTVAELDGETLTYQDLCAKNNGECVVGGDVFLSQSFKTHLANNNNTVRYPIWVDNNIPYDFEPLVGKSERSAGVLTKAEYLKLTFHLRSDSTEVIEKVRALQEKFVETMEEFNNANFDFAFSHTDSLSSELNANIGGDIVYFSVTFTLMITFACFATYPASNDNISNRIIMGLCGVMAAGLGIVASLGLVSAAGMSFVSIVGNMPFLILGIGVDDMFILLSGLIQAGFAKGIKERIGTMMRVSGVAITITSLTNILAFACGAISTFKSVRNFCVYTGVAIVFCYINQCTFFAACLSLNEKRIQSKRHYFAWCKTVKSKNEYKLLGSSGATIFCCGGHIPKGKRDIDSYLERFPGWLLPKIVLNIFGKVIILLAFLVYLGFAIWGAINLEQGLVIRNLVSESSYFYKFTTWEEEFFVSRVPVSFVIENTVEYHTTAIQTKIDDLETRVRANQYMSDTTSSWLVEYKSTTMYDDTSEVAFISGLNLFLSTPRYMRYRNDVRISSDNNTITASRVYIFTNNIENSQDSGQMMVETREIADDTSDLTVTAFAPPFIFYEQYVAILPQTLQTLGASLACVLVITAFFMPHPLLLLYIVVTMAMIIVGIVGFMQHWGLTLSSITMIHIIMSVGFSVDYTAHTCHAFMVANGKDRNERVKKALQSAGSPIFNGALSSIIGVAMLAAAKSYIFNSFFRVMVLVILFGIGHSVLFLPVVLSIIGPGKSKEDPEPDYHDDTVYSVNRVSPIPRFSSAKSRLSEVSVHEKMEKIVDKNPKMMALYDGTHIRAVKSPTD